MRSAELGWRRCRLTSFVRLISLVLQFVSSPLILGKLSYGATFSIYCPIMFECTDHLIFIRVHFRYLLMSFN